MDEERRISPTKALKNARMCFSAPSGYMEWVWLPTKTPDRWDLEGVEALDLMLESFTDGACLAVILD